MARQPLSSVDVAWLRMEEPTNLMMVTVLLLFDEPLDPARLRATLSERLLAFPRFRQRVVRPVARAGQPHWEDDPHFQMSSHLRRIALPAPGGDLELEELVGDLMSTPLDYSKPLWQAHLVEGYGGGCALLVRLHHCIADGIALVHVMLSLTDTSPSPRRRPAGKPSAARTDGSPLGALPRLAGQAFDLVRNPTRALDLARLGADGASSLAVTTLLPADPPTVFKGPLGVTKRAAWSRPLSLGAVKAIGRATSTTVNDVLVAAATGALRQYLVDRGQPVSGLEIRASVPVNLRPLEEAWRLGNSFGLVFLALPVGLPRPRQRLLEVKRRMERIKGSSEAATTFAVLNAVGMLPSEVESLALRFFGSKSTAVMTNVPGPQHPLYLAGGRIGRIMFWVPLAGRLGLGLSILSYAGEVMLGVSTDAGLVPDPQAIVSAFHDEIELLSALVRPARAAEARARPIMGVSR